MKLPANPKPIDQQFAAYNECAAISPYRFLLYPAIALFMFGLLSFTWAIPFPHLAFFGRYNGFINWASFLIAGVIYYYMRLSPVVSYVMLLVLFAFSYGIIQLEKWQKAGGPQLWAIGGVCLVVGFAIQFFVLQKKNKQLKTILMGPAWFFLKILKTMSPKF